MKVVLSCHKREDPTIYDWRVTEVSWYLYMMENLLVTNENLCKDNVEEHAHKYGDIFLTFKKLPKTVFLW